MPRKPGVVLDCNVLLQAIVRPDSVADQCLQLAESGAVQLVVSRATLAEITEVLERPLVRAQFPHLSDEIVGAFLIRLQKCSRLQHPVPVKFCYSRDPNDEPYINLAVAADAAYIVSRDRDLLDLMSGYSGDCKEFRQRFRPLKVIEPLELLRLARGFQSPPENT